MTNLTKSQAMRCFGKLVEAVELDPDPNAREILIEKNNCFNCDTFQYCTELALTLSRFK